MIHVKIKYWLLLCFLVLAGSANSIEETLMGCKVGNDLGIYNYFRRSGLPNLEDPSWVTISRDKLSAVGRSYNVPVQGGYTYRVSCGPISVARALDLMGVRKENWDWHNFIVGFDYFAGGVYLHVLTEHTNKKSFVTDFNLKQIKFEHFEDVMHVVRKEISYGRPAIALLVLCALGQHYVNIVGYNDIEQKVLILDPNSSFKVFSYSWLQDVMYAGISKSYGLSYFVESLAAIPTFMGLTTFGYYNLFIFKR